MKAILKNIWKPAKGVIIRDLDKNLFSFQFFSNVDKEYVSNEATWAFDGYLLLLKGSWARMASRRQIRHDTI